MRTTASEVRSKKIIERVENLELRRSAHMIRLHLDRPEMWEMVGSEVEVAIEPILRAP